MKKHSQRLPCVCYCQVQSQPLLQFLHLQKGRWVSQALFSLMFTVRTVYEVKSQSIRTPINFSVTAVDCIQSRFINWSFACVTS
jgi:hypothetical protein